ncbi:hypothetical protein CGRA01v4_09379 [Colletotrichum graminicola]|nr:hypothetical protein CGRA01v4_09379 [Colletotrichum graminicola]
MRKVRTVALPQATLASRGTPCLGGLSFASAWSQLAGVPAGDCTRAWLHITGLS